MYECAALIWPANAITTLPRVGSIRWIDVPHCVIFGELASPHRNMGFAVRNRKVLDDRVAGTRLEIPRHPRVELPTVRSVLQKRPSTLHSVDAAARLPEALKVLSEPGFGAILVLDAGRPVGIFSEHDYVRALNASTTTRVGEVMSPCDTTGALPDSAHACLSRMIEKHLRYLPILEEGNPVALLSREDLLSELLAYLERVFKENELDHQIASLQGTYSC